MRRRMLLVALAGLAVMLVVTGTTMLWPRPAGPINFEISRACAAG